MLWRGDTNVGITATSEKKLVNALWAHTIRQYCQSGNAGRVMKGDSCNKIHNNHGLLWSYEKVVCIDGHPLQLKVGRRGTLCAVCENRYSDKDPGKYFRCAYQPLTYTSSWYCGGKGNADDKRWSLNNRRLANPNCSRLCPTYR